MITQFVVQEIGNKATIFALDEHSEGHSVGTDYVSKLTAVTTLTGPHVEHAGWATWCMNHYLSSTEVRVSSLEVRFAVLASKLPRPVWQAIATFLGKLNPLEPGAFDEQENVAIRDVQGFTVDSTGDLSGLMRSAFDLELGIRIANAKYDSGVEWAITIRSAAGVYRNDLIAWSGERRTWALPSDVPLLQSYAVHDDIHEALRIASSESSNGRRVRIHLATPYFVDFEEEEDIDEIDTDPDHYWVVDVFDAPVPDRFTESGDVREL